MSWPMMRGTPEHGGGGIPHLPTRPPRTRWSVAVGNRGLGAPLISVNRVICSALRESGAVLVGLDRQTGAEVWQVPFEVLPSCYWTSGVLVEREDAAVMFDDEVARLVRLEDGGVLLEKPLGSGSFATSPATVSGDCLYVGMVHRLVCFEASSLRTRWSFAFPPDLVIYAAPAIRGGTVFVHAVGASGTVVVALSASNGARKWSTSLPGVARTVATVTEARLVLLMDGEGRELLEIDPLSGRLLGSTRVGAGLEPTGVTGIEDGVESADGLVFYSSDGDLVALSLESRQIAWRASSFPRSVVAPVVAGGIGYLAGTDGELVAWKPLTGEALWRFPLGVPVASSVAVAEDGLVILSVDGRVTAIALD